MSQYKLTEWATYMTGDHYTAPGIAVPGYALPVGGVVEKRDVRKVIQ